METFDKFKSLIGRHTIEFSIPILGVYDWWKEKHKLKVPKRKKKIELVWEYKGCDCIPEDSYLSTPYCVEHYNPLVRTSHEIKTT